MRAWNVWTADHRTGEITPSVVIDTKDDDRDTFEQRQKDKFGCRFVRAERHGLRHQKRIRPQSSC